MDDGQDLETDLILLSARGKRLVILRDRPRHAARSIGEAVPRARIAVESGQV